MKQRGSCRPGAPRTESNATGDREGGREREPIFITESTDGMFTAPDTQVGKDAVVSPRWNVPLLVPHVTFAMLHSLTGERKLDLVFT